MYDHSSTHAARNDAQLLVLRQTKPALWARLLETASEEERQDIEARCRAAELAEFATTWDERADALARVAAALRGEQPEAVGPRCPRCGQLFGAEGRCGCPPPAPARVHATAQMIRDVWQDENGPQRVAHLLRQLPDAERHRLCVDYWGLLRQSGCHGLSLVEVGIQFELAMQRAA